MLLTRQRILVFLALAWTLIAWQTVQLYTEDRVSQLFATDSNELADDVFSLQNAINERLTHLASLPSITSRLDAVKEATDRFNKAPTNLSDNDARKRYWTENPQLKALDAQLAVLKAELGVDILFLMNEEGYCIASSNSDSPESFIGTRYNDRHYFTEAMLGKPASQYAVGRKTNIPGLFFSAPVLVKDQPRGVLVIKADIPKLAPLLAPYSAFLTDSHGVVILSNKPFYLSHLLPGSNFQTLSTEERLLQYKQVDLPPLAITAIPKKDNDPALVRMGPDPDQPLSVKNTDQLALATDQQLNIHNLTLHVIKPINNVLQARSDVYYITLVTVLAGYFILGLLYQSFLYLQRIRASETAAREQNQDLQNALKQHEQQLNTIVDHLPMMVVARDAKSGAILKSNPAAQEILRREIPLTLGQSYTEQLPQPLAHFLTENDDQSQVEGSSIAYREQYLKVDDASRTLRALTVALLPEGQKTSNLLIDLVEDVTEVREREQEIHRLAYADFLTNLPNRAAFIGKLEESITRLHNERRFGALLLTDIDGFKLINDRLGRTAGDQILIEVAHRLIANQGEETFPARLASDEFVIILETNATTDQDAVAEATCFGKSLLDSITAPYHINGLTLHLTASFGVALFGPEEPTTADELLRATDAAMYEAKRSHRGGIHFFDAEVRKLLEERAELGGRLLSALRSQSFEQRYQPQLDTSNHVIGVEALIRWQDPVLGNVSPATFIPLAETLHVIVDIDRWVLHHACKTAGLWRNDPALGNIVISVNVSAEFFGQEDFIASITDAIHMNHVDPKQIMIELTEGAAIANDVHTVNCINQLHALGCKVAIDDFGTGNSSLSYMRQFTVDQLKIDQSFVKNMLSDQRSLAIIEHVISLSKALNYNTLAEGVETIEQRNRLSQLGCMHFQGYLFAQAMPLEACVNYIRTQNGTAAMGVVA